MLNAQLARSRASVALGTVAERVYACARCNVYTATRLCLRITARVNNGACLVAGRAVLAGVLWLLCGGEREAAGEK